jgi:hypothetical protein
MNAKRWILPMAIALGLTAGGGQVASASTSLSAGIAIGPSGHASVDVGFFYSNLSGYGRWVDRPSYGRVFIPRVAHFGWRPYRYGHWVETDWGWTWISDEPFGWATYHYGRWSLDPDYGWVWVPGTDWGPAWVDFHEGDGYIGWAPLPPSVGFDFSYGVRLGGYSIAPQAYCFVPERRFLEPRIATYVMAPTRNVTIFNNTRNITNYTVVNNRIVNHGIDPAHIEQVTGRRVPRLQVAEATRPGQRVMGDRVAFFRPTVQRQPVAANAARRNEPVQAQQRAAVAGRQAQQQAEVRRTNEARRANDTAVRESRIQAQRNRSQDQQRMQADRRQAQVAQRAQQRANAQHVREAQVARRQQQADRQQQVRAERQQQAQRQQPQVRAERQQQAQRQQPQVRAERQQQAQAQRQQQAQERQQRRRQVDNPPPPAQPRAVERRQMGPRPERANVQPQPSNRPPRNDRQGQPQPNRQRPPRDRGNQGNG